MKKLAKTQHSENMILVTVVWFHHFMANRWGNNGNSERRYWGGGAPKSLQMLTLTMKLKDACSLEEKL